MYVSFKATVKVRPNSDMLPSRQFTLSLGVFISNLTEVYISSQFNDTTIAEPLVAFKKPQAKLLPVKVHSCFRLHRRTTLGPEQDIPGRLQRLQRRFGGQRRHVLGGARLQFK